jgi:gluconokinase
MSDGVPLTDEDRQPWLEAIGRWVDERVAEGHSVSLTCSALRRRYRDLLRSGRPYLRFCHVTADPDLIRARVEARRGHYMPSSLLPSQLATLEPLGADEPGVAVTADGDPADVLARALHLLGLDVEGDSS